MTAPSAGDRRLRGEREHAVLRADAGERLPGDAVAQHPQAVPEVQDRFRDKLETGGVSLTPEILRALAFAIVNDRGA